MIGILLFLMTIAGLTVTAVGWFGFTGQLKRNRFAGIRTSYTLSSDERWAAVHRSGGPLLIFGGVAVTAAGLAFAPFALAGKVPEAAGLSVVIACAVMLALAAIASWLYGVSRAKGQGA